MWRWVLKADLFLLRLMGQQSSRQGATSTSDSLQDAATVSPVSRRASSSRLGALSRKLRPLSSRRKASFFGNLFRSRESDLIQTDIANVSNNTPVASNPLESASSVPDPPHSPPVSTLPEPNVASPESLTIMEGAISTLGNAYRNSSDRHSLSQDHSSIPESLSRSNSLFSASNNGESSGSEQPLPAPAMDERLQSSIDILAALLSMATAATATSLLTGTTDVLSTLASDSPSGPQVSPTRARAAWDILQNLFYIRLNRESTLSPHVELFRDLALAVLTARTGTTPVMPRHERPALPAGTFERFLVDLNASVRTSLRDDYTRRGGLPTTDETGTGRRLNWWRAYQFPSLVTDMSDSASSHAAGETGTPHLNSRRHPTSPRQSQDQERDSGRSGSPRGSPQSSGNLVPVVLVGLRSLSRDNERNVPGFAVSPTPSHSNSSPSPNTTPESASPLPRSPTFDRPTADNVDAITSSYVIIVLGGHYPPEHRYASTIGSEDANELDQLWDLVDLVPTGPKTTTAEEISKAGLTCFKASKISDMQVAENTAERCLICLEEYEKEVDLRLLKCSHAFHKDCVDRWLTEGQNGCPLCRAQGVQR